jgi:hypothetical protein
MDPVTIAISLVSVDHMVLNIVHQFINSVWLEFWYTLLYFQALLISTLSFKLYKAADTV